jgi:hypothetical protein
MVCRLRGGAKFNLDGITASWFWGTVREPLPQSVHRHCIDARWLDDAITVSAHLIYMRLVTKFWHFHKDTPADIKHFIACFSPGALNWVVLLPSKFYLPGNMQMLFWPD